MRLRKLFITIFLLMTMIPFLHRFAEIRAVSDVSEMESQLKSELALGSALSNAYITINDKVFDELISPHYQYGKEGYVFLKMSNNNYYSDYYRLFAESVKKMKDYCETRGTNFYFMFYPEKASIDRKYLPTGVNYDDAWVDEMLSYMESLGIKCVNCRETLLNENIKTPVFNRLYDAGHWNARGAFLGTNALLDTINKDFEEVHELSESDFVISESVAEKLIDSEITINEKIPKYELIGDISNMDRNYEESLNMGNIQPFFSYRINNGDNADKLPKVLLFQDNMLQQFTISWASESIELRSFQNILNLDYYYNIFTPEIVVFEAKENSINSSFYKVEEMERMAFPDSILSNYPQETFIERRDELLSEIEQVEYPGYVAVVEGSAIDSVYIDINSNYTDSMYLITDKKVIDLKQEQEKVWSATVDHGDLSEDTLAVVYIIDKNGAKEYTILPVMKTANIADRSHLTDGVIYDEENKSYTLNSQLDNNSFYQVSLQIWDRQKEDLLYNLCSTTLTCKGAGYYHPLKSGMYKLIIRCNSNLKDEYIEYNVKLEKGRCYWYEFCIDEATEKSVALSKISFNAVQQ